MFIGDVHGKFDLYKNLIQGYDKTVQVGDLGVGFDAASDAKLKSIHELSEGSNRFIRGNHDNPSVAAEMPGFIKDGTVENETMYVGGAYSIDKLYRTENVDWWKDEECSYEQFGQLLSVYEVVKPRVMVTHDCPGSITKELFGYSSTSLTSQAFSAFFSIHKPDLWVFGHHHEYRLFSYAGTDFVCLNELGTLYTREVV